MAKRDLDRLLSVLIFSVAFSLFVGFLTTHHSYDAVAAGVLLYQWIANGAAEQLFHPYHILYLPLGAALDALLGRLGLGWDPLMLLQTINTVFAAGALALFYRLARRLDLARSLSLLLVALFGLGFSYWYYASNAEPYPVSIFFLILAMLSALELKPAATAWQFARPGIWLGLAIGFHVTCVLALPALLLAAWPGVSSERPWHRPAIALIAAGLVALAPYAAAYAYFDRTDLISGLSGELKATVDPGYRGKVWWSVDLGNVMRQWRSLGEAAAPAVRPNLRASYPAVAAALAHGLLALTLLPALLLLGPRERVLRVSMLALWFLPAFFFFSSYNTASEKFASYQWAPLLLLIGFAVRGSLPGRVARRAALGFMLLLAAGIFVSSFDLVRRQTDPRTNPYLERALAIARHTEPDDLVIHLGRGDNQYQKVYTPYFAVRRSIVLDSWFDKTRRSAGESLRAIGDQIEQQTRQAHHVFVLSDAVEVTASSREFEEFHGLEPGTLGRFFAEFQPQVIADEPALGRLWSLGPAAGEGDAL